MTTLSIYRFKAIIAAEHREKCNAQLEELGHGPDNFSLPILTSDKEHAEEPTHYGTDWQCTPEEWAIIQPILDTHRCKYSLENQADKKIRESNVPTLDAKAGVTVKFDDLTAAMGLKRRVVPI